MYLQTAFEFGWRMRHLPSFSHSQAITYYLSFFSNRLVASAWKKDRCLILFLLINPNGHFCSVCSSFQPILDIYESFKLYLFFCFQPLSPWKTANSPFNCISLYLHEYFSPLSQLFCWKKNWRNYSIVEVMKLFSNVHCHLFKKDNVAMISLPRHIWNFFCFSLYRRWFWKTC